MTGVAVLVMLGVLFGVMNVRRQSLTSDNSSGSIIIPTPVRVPNTSISSPTTVINSLDDLNSADQEKLKDIQLALPVEDENVAIEYSPVTQQLFVQKKTPQADLTFNQFLANNGLTSLYQTQPNYFVITTNNIRDEVSNAEENAIDTLISDDDDDGLDSVPKTNDTKIEEILAQFNALKNLASIIAPPPQITPTPQQRGDMSPTPTDTPQNQSSNDLDYAAKNSCYRFRINRCDDIPESRPGVTNNTYPVDTALVNELFANPNAYGLRNRRWQFDAGMVHPKLVRFLNEFVKSNTLDRHLGIAGGTGRCCRRNGSTKGPATGCKLTPHRLGVAIDLDTLNGSRFIKAKQDDPGIRKALDWINAQRGSLRPDSVTMSPLYAGLYPFHPDSGHADHLHLDFSRSLACQ